MDRGAKCSDAAYNGAPWEWRTLGVADPGSGWVSQFDEGLWPQWPSPSTESCFWHITTLGVAGRHRPKYQK